MSNGDFDSRFGFAPTDSKRFGLPDDEAAFDKRFGFTGPSAAAAPALPALTDRTFGEGVLDFIADQLDPLNLAALVASVSGWGLAGRLVGPGLKATGAVTRFGSQILAPSMTARVVRRAAQGLGGALPFAVAEAVESPEPGTTRLGNFGRELLILEALDLALFIPLGGAVNAARRSLGKLGLQEAREATAASIAEAKSAIMSAPAAAGGRSEEMATAMAMAGVLEGKIRQVEREMGPGFAREVLNAVDNIGSADPQFFTALIANNADRLLKDPALAEFMIRQGLDPQSLPAMLDLLAREQQEMFAQKIMQQAGEAAELNSQFASGAAAKLEPIAANQTFSRQEFMKRSGVTETELDELIRDGVIQARGEGLTVAGARPADSAAAAIPNGPHEQTLDNVFRGAANPTGSVELQTVRLSGGRRLAELSDAELSQVREHLNTKLAANKQAAVIEGGGTPLNAAAVQADIDAVTTAMNARRQAAKASTRLERRRASRRGDRTGEERRGPAPPRPSRRLEFDPGDEVQDIRTIIDAHRRDFPNVPIWFRDGKFILRRDAPPEAIRALRADLGVAETVGSPTQAAARSSAPSFSAIEKKIEAAGLTLEQALELGGRETGRRAKLTEEEIRLFAVEAVQRFFRAGNL